MSKFIQSHESIDSSLLLWDVKSTQTAIQSVYELEVYPITVYDNDYGGPITFVIPPQIKGELIDVEVIATWRVKADEDDLTGQHVTTINNVGNSLWSMVDIQVGDRLNIMQSMSQAYAYQTFFETALNTEPNRADYIYAMEMFKMDDGKDKTDTETLQYYHEDAVLGADDAVVEEEKFVKNHAAAARANRITLSQKVTTLCKLHCPLFRHSKALPTNMHIRVSLTKNSNEFLLLAADTVNFKLNIEEVFLKCKYIRPTDFIIQQQEDKLIRQPALYDVDVPEISFRTINVGETNVTFNGKTPKAAFFCVQNPLGIHGAYGRNPFVFEGFKSAQVYKNNIKLFTSTLVMDDDSENFTMLNQLYKSINKDLHGSCLINSKNYHLNQIVGTVFTADKTHTKHLNLKEDGDVRIELGFVTAPKNPLIVIIYAVYDKIIQIDVNSRATITE